MTAIKRRFAAASLAALMPLAAISIATAAPSVAETTCGAGQSEFNGSCVDNCNKSQVRNSDTGKCQSLLSAALQKAETPAVAKLTPEQMGGAWQLAQQARVLPEGTRVWNSVVGTVDTVVGWPVLATSAAADIAATLAFIGVLPGSANGGGGNRIMQSMSAANDIAQVARSLPSPQVGLPKIGMPPHPKLGFPPHPKIGMPRIGMPKLGASGICGPKLLFFTPCL